MFHHQRNEFVIGKLFPAEPEFAIHGLTATQQVAGPDAHLADEVAEFLLTERFDVVVDLFKRDTTFAEEAIHLAAFRARGFFVNRDRRMFHLRMLSERSGTWQYTASRKSGRQRPRVRRL